MKESTLLIVLRLTGFFFLNEFDSRFCFINLLGENNKKKKKTLIAREAKNRTSYLGRYIKLENIYFKLGILLNRYEN